MRKNKTVPNKEVDMTSIADVSVRIQTSSDSIPSTPCWFGEVALLIPYLRKQGILSAINSQVRLARRRFGRYEVIDFLAVLFGYAISGERTLEADLTSACNPLPLASWLSSDESSCQHAPR